MTNEQIIERLEIIVDEYEVNKSYDHPNYDAEDIIDDIKEILTTIEIEKITKGN